MNTNLSDELRNQLLESAAWGKAGITPVMNEEKAVETEEEAVEVVLGLVDRLSQMNEGDEDVDAVIDSALEDLLVGTTEEEE